ncbi:hypothetical protein BX666DRAFT_1865875 [Dichotomocladium elegans]|nr:hypothetical protein BX666DRAFT_1865875 [Dichotomocladium elegans]
MDVALPRAYVYDSIRRIQKNDNNNDFPDTTEPAPQQHPSASTTTTATATAAAAAATTTRATAKNAPPRNITDTPEDAVFRDSSDEAFLPPDELDDDEKFITFLPHSGFHNQRIAVVNALLLAGELNRTLLMPPVMLGDPVHWRKYDSSESFHRRSTKAHIAKTCKSYSGKKAEDMPEECAASFRFTSLRWDRLFDLRQLKQRIKIRYRDDYSRNYLELKYNITNRDTYRIKDESLYDYRISDKEGQALNKYQREVFIWDLAKRPERLLSFGSLFGTGRVMYSTPESQELRDFVYSQFVFSREALPDLFDEADAIIKRLGGPRSYIAVHARVGDSIFERFSPQVMGKLWGDLQHKYNAVLAANSALSASEVEQTCLDPKVVYQHAIDRTSMITPRPLVMFMATDSPDPRAHPLMERIFDTFPCVVTLRDVFDFKKSKLANLVNPEDGVVYGKFLVPFLDGLIASRAQEFTGSMWSTFSGYIRFLHQQYSTST